MHQFFLLLSVILWVFSCSRINNSINKIEFDCGEEGNFKQYRYAKIYGMDGAINSSDDLQVWTESGEQLKNVLTSKACLRLPANSLEKIIVARKSSEEGLAFYPDRSLNQTIAPLNLMQHKYGTLHSTCKTEIATNSSQLKWPFDFSSVRSEDYRWDLRLSRGADKLVNIQKSAFADLSRDEIDISKLSDGAYTLSIKVQELFSESNKPMNFECTLYIDRVSPIISVDRELVRLEGENDLTIQAAPGEAIKIRTSHLGSNENIYACLISREKASQSCIYDQISGGFITAPQRGNWVLRIYGRDAANNMGPVSERDLQVFDNSLVGTIKSYIEQAVVAQKSGSSLNSMIAGIKAYEKMKSLGSPSEHSAVRQGVRKAIFESTLLPAEEMVFFSKQGFSMEGLGFVRKDNEWLFMAKDSPNSLDLFATTGESRGKIDLSNLLGMPSVRFETQFCEAKSVLVAYGKNVIGFFVDAKLVKTINLGKEIDLAGYSDISGSCDFVRLYAGNKHILVNVSDMDAKIIDQPLEGVLVGVLDNGKKLITSSNGIFLVYDLESGSKRTLAEFFGLPDVRKFMTLQDGSLSVLTSDQTLHILDRSGQKIFEIQQVLYFSRGLLEHEIIVIQNPNILQIVSTLNGSVNSRASVSGSNWDYLTANEDFIVGLSAGSNVVKIWTRTGNPLDEIYNKGDAIRKIWVSPTGYLYVSSSQYSKIYKLQNPLSQKQVPHYWNALGLQFTSDGKQLLYKEQQPEAIGVQTFAYNNLVSWNVQSNQRSIYSLPSIAPSSKIYPGFGAQTRDLEYFSADGQPYVAATVKRGSVGIYQVDDLNNPLETYDLTSNWLLDVAVAPSGEMFAAASLNGLVFVVGRKNGGWGAFSLNDVYPHYFEEYPVTLHFDRTGKYLYVTDVNNNLMKFAVDFKQETQEYVLNLQNSVNNAGVNLAINGDTLAVVGNGVKLNIYDSNLQLLNEHIIASTPANPGKSVTFSPDGTKVYAGVYDGTWNELDLKSGQLLKVRFSSAETGATNLVVAPKGDQLAFVGGGFVQIADLNVDRVYKNICSWLKPRLPFILDLSEDDRRLCSGL